MTTLVEHHTHYKEIHGYDKTVWLTKSEHVKLHKKLRKEGKCSVPVNELAKIAIAAHGRTTKRRKYLCEYRKLPKSKEYHKNYRQTPKCKDTRSKYYNKNYVSSEFTESMQPYVSHRLMMRLNKSTSNIDVYAGFRATGGKKLWYHEVQDHE